MKPSSVLRYCSPDVGPVGSAGTVDVVCGCERIDVLVDVNEGWSLLLEVGRGITETPRRQLDY